jgi:hypothetical protein
MDNIISEAINSDKLDEALHLTKSEIKETIIERSQRGRKAKIWFHSQCYRERKATLEALHKANDTTNPRELQTYVALRKGYKALLKRERHAQLEREAMQMAEAAK